jgi:hypothetical protein
MSSSDVTSSEAACEKENKINNHHKKNNRMIRERYKTHKKRARATQATTRNMQKERAKQMKKEGDGHPVEN